MKYKRLTVIALVTLMTISVLLLLTGCPQHIDSLYGLKVTGDGAGGAIAIYEDTLGGNVYAQKISADGEALWGEKGVLLGSSHSRGYTFAALEIVSDDSRGAIVSWVEITSSQGPYVTSVYHISRLDSNGRSLWQKDLQRVDQLISDGAGGAILYHSQDGKAFVVRIDSNGNFPWGETGVLLPRPGNFRQIASDGAGRGDSVL